MGNNCKQILSEVLTFLKKSKRLHNYCEDTWYSCPKHPEGCSGVNQPDECDCGADEYNEQVDALLEKINKVREPD